jgi:acyl carrier protein
VVKRQSTHDPQPIKIAAEADLNKMEVHVKWFNPAKELWYCHATVSYEDPSSWLSNWSRSAKLITSRIEALNAMAAAGSASKLTTDLAYSLFGKLVDYSKMYRTMQSVILNEDEAVAEVVFPHDTSGTWTVPPHFIDGCISLSGFVLNGGTHFENTKNFFITPSWKSMRFAKPLTPGGRYLAYVRMVPAENHSFVGDVYILQGSEIVGVVEAILFLQWPRVMLNRFFSPPDAAAKTTARMPAQSKPASLLAPAVTPARPTQPSDSLTSSPVIVPQLDQGSSTRGLTTLSLTTGMTPGTTPGSSSGAREGTGVEDITARALVMIAEELAVDVGQLTDEVELGDLGLDSLMSLVLSQKLRDGLGIEMRDAFFLEVDTIGELKRLLR